MKFRSLTASVFCAASVAAPADGAWTGWISESQCAAQGAHEGAGECTTGCVKEKGAKHVFVNDADKKVYVVDAQDKVAEHAGHHVTVKGSVDGDNLKLASISMAK
jgi:pyruvoyl-dependent arginine decarboxylase (PvlArgDC)